jgi:ribokinase
MHVVVTPDGDRTILGLRGANALTDPAMLRVEDFQESDLFYLSGYALLAETQRSAALLAVELARQHALPVALDPGLSGHPVAADRLRGHLPGVDLFLPNLAEARELTGRVAPRDCAQALLDAGVRLVALKLGQAGCLIYDGVAEHHLPGFDVEARDTTGAGDSFAAGLLAGYLAGLDWPAAGTLANAMGALTTTVIGSGGGGPLGGKLLSLLACFPPKPGASLDPHWVGQVIAYLQALPA